MLSNEKLVILSSAPTSIHSMMFQKVGNLWPKHRSVTRQHDHISWLAMATLIKKWQSRRRPAADCHQINAAIKVMRCKEKLGRRLLRTTNGTAIN